MKEARIVLVAICLMAVWGFGNLGLAQELQPVRLDWKMSDLIHDCDGPVDAHGNHWYEFDFDDSFWQPVELRHHIRNSSAVDRFYRATFALNFVPAQAEISFESDDGLWVYINERFVGHWGGDCYQPCCVNP
jgi:hypothetical protein